MRSLIIIGVWLAIFSSLSKAQDRTTGEFREYVGKKTANRFSSSKLDRLVKLVDKNNDGIISNDEFEARQTALKQVILDKPEAQSKRDNRDSLLNLESIPEFTHLKDSVVLLITSESLSKAWVPFAKWKTVNGKPTKIITVKQISENYKANSIQEKIRICVLDHVENHRTKWVVLGGDSLPGGNGHVPGGHTTVHAQEPNGIPTDIVYLSKSDWDADRDGIIGEFKDDQTAISYPDGSVGLGRVPVRTTKDVAAFTDKIVAYESKYPTENFAESMIYTCTDSPAYPKVKNSWDGYLAKKWNGKMGRFFSQETPWDKDGIPGSYPLSAGNLVNLFNEKKTGKLHIHGHGHLPAWVLEKSQFTGSHIQQLENSGAYPLITTVSCNTGEYDSKKDPSIVEQLLRVPNAGSVAVVAPIRTGKPHFANRSDFRLMITEGKLDGTTMTMTRYWSYGLGNQLSTGESIMKAKSAMEKDARKSAAYHLCICELNLLGDPTLDMRASNPRKLEFSISNKVSNSINEILVSTDAPGSTICVWDSSDVYFVAIADEKGNAKIPIESKSAEINVTVSGASLNSSTKKLNLRASSIHDPTP